MRHIFIQNSLKTCCLEHGDRKYKNIFGFESCFAVPEPFYYFKRMAKEIIFLKGSASVS